MRRIILIFIILTGLFAAPAYPYWIWTPKTGKWINPKHEVKQTPKEQFDFAKGLYDAKDHPAARREFRKLIRSYPKSFEASESQYYLGLVEEALDNLYEAYKAYQKVIDVYPFSERISEINEREYKIAEAFMSGEKRKAMGMALPVENPAIEILSKIVENSTYGPLAAKAQYKLGLVLKSLLRYYEAEDAFNKVVSSYPDSEWTEASKFQIASCRAAISKGASYDQGAAGEAKEKFEDFVREHPDAVLSREAEKNINELREKEAQANFEIARFYEKQKAYEAAKTYYVDVIMNYKDSGWAQKAQERLKMMETKK